MHQILINIRRAEEDLYLFPAIFFIAAVNTYHFL